MADVLESSESLSSPFVRPEPKPCSATGFVVVSKPVPCTICKTQFKNREEQIQHYHEPQHAEKASRLVQEKSAAFFKPQNAVTFEDAREIETVYIEQDDSLSQSGSLLSYYCADCGVEFAKESAYKAHLKTKRHANSCKAEQGNEPELELVGESKMFEKID